MRLPKIPGHSAFKDPWAMTVMAGMAFAWCFDNPEVVKAAKDTFAAAVEDYQQRTRMSNIFESSEPGEIVLTNVDLDFDYPLYRHDSNMTRVSSTTEFERCIQSPWTLSASPYDQDFTLENDVRTVLVYSHGQTMFGQEYGFVEVWSEDCSEVELSMNGVPVYEG